MIFMTKITKIEQLRTKHCLSQYSFSKLVHIPLHLIQQWELGQSVPPTYVVSLIELLLEQHYSIAWNQETYAFIAFLDKLAHATLHPELIQPEQGDVDTIRYSNQAVIIHGRICYPVIDIDKKDVRVFYVFDNYQTHQFVVYLRNDVQIDVMEGTWYATSSVV